MLLTELNSEFEILFEDLATAGSKGLDDYEKSVCYTYAQDSLVKQLAEGNLLDPIKSLVDTFQNTGPGVSEYKQAQ